MGAMGGGSSDPKAPFAQMMMVALMMSMGVGNLALPSGVEDAGLLTFLYMFLFVAGSMMWSMGAMLRAKGAIEERGIKVFTYQDLGYDLIGGETGRRLVDVMVVGYQFGVCCAYFAFSTGTLRELMPDALTKVQWTLLVAPLVAVPCNLRHFRDLGQPAKVATACYVVAWGTVMVYAFERLAVRGDVYNENLGPEDARWWFLLKFFGMLCYAFEGIPATLCQMANTLSEPERINELVAKALGGISLVLLATGYVGVLAFEHPENPITLNLMDEFGKGGIPGLVNGLVVCAVLLRYPLQFSPMISQIEQNLGVGPGSRFRNVAPPLGGGDAAVPPEARKLLAAESAALLAGDDDSIFVGEHDGGFRTIALRCSLVGLTALIAVLVDDLTSIINFVGICFGPSLAFVLPCFFDIVCIHRRAYRRSKLQLAVSIAIALSTTIFSLLGLGQQIVTSIAGATD